MRLLKDNLDDAVAGAKPAGSASFHISLAASQSSSLNRPPFLGKDTLASFDTPSARHQRLLELYLSERRYIIKTCEHIVFTALYESTSKNTNDGTEGRSGWIAALGHDILSTWNIHGYVRDTRKNFLVSTIEAINTRIKALESGSGWSSDEGVPEELELAFARNQILEIIHAMQILLILLESSQNLPRSDACLGWFRLMATHGFFEGFQPVSTEPCLRVKHDLISAALSRVSAALRAITAVAH